MSDLDTSDFPQDEIRDEKSIARRALALFGTVALSFGAPRNKVISWLKDSNLWEELSPSELAYLSAKKPSKKQNINASWNSESLIVLLWALNKTTALPAPNEQCNTSLFQELLPPYGSVSVADFISSSTRRTDEILLTAADELLEFHWQARDAALNGRPIPPHLDIGIIQERHHAINWTIGYEGLPWDEVTTDT
jgi:hypothetical protein